MKIVTYMSKLLVISWVIFMCNVEICVQLIVTRTIFDTIMRYFHLCVQYTYNALAHCTHFLLIVHIVQLIVRVTISMLGFDPN